MLKPIITLTIIVCLIIIAIITLGIYLDNVLNKSYSKLPAKSLDIYKFTEYDSKYYKDFLNNWLEENKEFFNE